MGMHMDGNHATVDPRGFVVEANAASSGARSHTLTRILGHPAIRGAEEWVESG